VVKKLNGAKLLVLEMLPQDNFDEDNFKPHSMLMIDSHYNYTQVDFTDASSEPSKVH
jgi:hypothetical protein